MPAYGLLPIHPRLLRAPLSVAGEQVEGSEPSASSPTTALQSATVENVSGQVIVSQQLHDRAMTGGGAFDVVVGRQIHQQLDEATDLYTLNVAIGKRQRRDRPEHVQNGLNLYQDLALAREKITDTAVQMPQADSLVHHE